MGNRLSRDAKAMRPSPIRALAKITADKRIISLAGGHPSPDSFPVDDIGKVIADLSRSISARELQYGMTAGNLDLRREIVGILAERGVDTALEQVFLCSGSQRGLDLIGRVLLDPGDTILVEIPTYPGAIACFRNLQAEMVGVPQDENGLKTDVLQKTLEKLRQDHRRPKLIYTIPNFQNPSGATMSVERRAELAEIAAREGLYVLEDDPYCDLYFHENVRDSLRPVAALGKGEVIYLSSFSKILAPGLRTAFISGPKDLIEIIELAAQASDLCSSTLDQNIVLELIRNGALKHSIGRIRQLYEGRATALLAALKASMPQSVEWNEPRGGFFLWVRMPDSIDAEEMLERAVKRGVAYVPGAHFCVDGSGRSEMRLCYSKESPERLREGAELLAQTIKETLQKS
ncbi:MAG TPA: PLP-dependent aminotransferase family protein [Acidobacteriota bacterium]|nr:PLP-dependent aminotransferase family protein [Acidobacteriota bacterium]